MTDFEGVVPTLAAAIKARGYDHLTPVQEAVLAPELKTADALVSAQTGSGKTVAFGMALAPTLLGDEEKFVGRVRQPLALIVAPTRELALQVMRELDWLYEKAGAKITSCIGGMDMRTERSALNRGAHIVVGTPGRLRDHIERGSLDVSALKAVVLDEADEMLDLGFRDDLEYILGSSPATRRTLMFSATVPRSIANLAKNYQNDPVRVIAKSEQGQHGDIDYKAYQIAPNDRENAIINLLRFHEAQSTIVFCATRATVNHMSSRLRNRGFSVVALSGELSQSERTHALQAMRDGRARVCVATDVAARGIDLPNLDLVIHADIPKNREGLLHRSGRTGRAGRKGVCALVVPHNWRKRTERLLQNAKIRAEWLSSPSPADIERHDRERLLTSPALSDPMNDGEIALASELLEKFDAQTIAGAFLRLANQELPVPEELLDATPVPAEKSRREDFKNGVWVCLSVGREQTAQPRWLIPLLCRAGHITKKEIGSIRIEKTETYVEIAPKSVEGFFAAVGPSKKLDKTISVDLMDGPPKGGAKRGPKAEADRPEKSKRKTLKAKSDTGSEGSTTHARARQQEASSEKRHKPEASEKGFEKPWKEPKSKKDKKTKKDKKAKRVQIATDGNPDRKPKKKKPSKDVGKRRAPSGKGDEGRGAAGLKRQPRSKPQGEDDQAV
jgi:ATP-dependent RNA helicase DeaD